MKITETKITIAELCKNYKDDGDGGVYAFDGKLTVRPSYQREFIYKDKQRDAVIETVFNGYPLNIMYWSKTGDDTYEVLDGQQRTISICQYINKDFPINHRFYHNLTNEEKQKILDYQLTVYICEGTEAEKLAWFKIINIAGEVLTPQELLNASYTGPWLADAKRYFSKRNCVAGQLGDGYISGKSIRQEYLEKVLKWIADRDGLENGQEYMAQHQQDDDASDIWMYYQTVMNWAKMLFPTKRTKINSVQDWGLLYNKYHDNKYNPNELEREIQKLLMDDDVTKKDGIIPYLLSNKDAKSEKFLSLRAFTDSQKLKAYERQKHQCPLCVKKGILDEYAFEDMQGDHILPWSKGGQTTDDNLQMLCRDCNNQKSDN